MLSAFCKCCEISNKEDFDMFSTELKIEKKLNRNKKLKQNNMNANNLNSLRAGAITPSINTTNMTKKYINNDGNFSNLNSKTNTISKVTTISMANQTLSNSNSNVFETEIIAVSNSNSKVNIFSLKETEKEKEKKNEKEKSIINKIYKSINRKENGKVIEDLNLNSYTLIEKKEDNFLNEENFLDESILEMENEKEQSIILEKKLKRNYITSKTPFEKEKATQIGFSLLNSNNKKYKSHLNNLNRMSKSNSNNFNDSNNTAINENKFISSNNTNKKSKILLLSNNTKIYSSNSNNRNKNKYSTPNILSHSLLNSKEDDIVIEVNEVNEINKSNKSNLNSNSRLENLNLIKGNNTIQSNENLLINRNPKVSSSRLGEVGGGVGGVGNTSKKFTSNNKLVKDGAEKERKKQSKNNNTIENLNINNFSEENDNSDNTELINKNLSNYWENSETQMTLFNQRDFTRLNNSEYYIDFTTNSNERDGRGDGNERKENSNSNSNSLDFSFKVDKRHLNFKENNFRFTKRGIIMKYNQCFSNLISDSRMKILVNYTTQFYFRQFIKEEKNDYNISKIDFSMKVNSKF